MEEIFMRILQMSLLASWGIVLVFGLRFFLKRISHTYAYLLWGIVLFRLACPVAWEAPVGLLPSWESAWAVFESGETKGAEPEPASIVNPQIEAAEGVGERGQKAGQIDREDLAEDSKASMERDLAQGSEEGAGTDVSKGQKMQDIWGNLGIWKVASAVWALGVLLFWEAGALSYVRFRGRLGDAVPCPADTLKEETGVGSEAGGRNRGTGPAVLLAHVDTPFVMGICRPRIYLPVQLEKRELQYILLHEKTHIRRGDHLIKLFCFVLLGIHWFNPLVHLALRYLERDMEMSCDEQVLERLGGRIKREYSASLLRLSGGGRISFGTPLSFGERDTRGRVRHVLDYKKPSFWVGAAALLAVAALGAGLLFRAPGTARTHPALTIERLKADIQNGEAFSVACEETGEMVSIPSGRTETVSGWKEGEEVLEDGGQNLRPVGEILDGLFQELMEGAPASGNPMDYVEARPEAFARILGYRYSTLAYCYTAFELGGQTGLKGHLMAEACRQITDGKTGENTGSPSYAEGQQDGAGETYGNGQEWYDARKALAEKMEAEQGWDAVVKYRPLEGSILQFLDGDMEGYTEEIFLPDYVYQGGDETEKLVYGSLRQMAEKEEPGYYDGFSVWAVWIHGTYDEGMKRKVIATVYEGKYHLYGNKIKEEGGSVIPMALTYERRTETGGAEETDMEGETKEGAYRLVSCERAGDGSYFLPSIRAFCTMPVSGEPIDGLAEAIVSTYGQDKDVAGPYGQDKGLDRIMEEHVKGHLEKWGVSRELP